MIWNVLWTDDSTIKGWKADKTRTLALNQVLLSLQSRNKNLMSSPLYWSHADEAKFQFCEVLITLHISKKE